MKREDKFEFQVSSFMFQVEQAARQELDTQKTRNLKLET